MHEYCVTWKLEVNAAKTKVVVFSRSCKNIQPFFYNNLKLDLVDDFSYLGVKFNYNGKFNKTLKYLCDQARKAMFSLLKKARKLCLDFDLQLQLFEATIVPILLYGSEVWGCGNVLVIKQFQLKFYKMMLKLKQSTPNVMVYGELGVLPVEQLIQARILNYWAKVVNSKSDRICHIMYNLMFELDKQNVFHFPWINYVKSTLDDLGFSEYWQSQSIVSTEHFHNIVKARIKDQYMQSWSNDVISSRKCFNYRLFKHSFQYESYLTELPTNLSLSLCHFRCCNHKLPIEKGRFSNIPRDERICNLCRHNTLLGDEYHYIFQCPFFNEDRSKYLSQEFVIPTVFNFENLFQNTDRHILLNLAIFAKKNMETFR